MLVTPVVTPSYPPGPHLLAFREWLGALSHRDVRGLVHELGRAEALGWPWDGPEMAGNWMESGLMDGLMDGFCSVSPG